MNIQTVCGVAAKVCGRTAKPAKQSETTLENHAHRRLRGFLKRKFPNATAENLAVILKVGVRQSYDLLSGRYTWSWRHVVRLISHFGEPLLHAVFHPLTRKDGSRRFRLRMPNRRKAVTP